MKQLYLFLALLLTSISAQAQLVPTGLKIGSTIYYTNTIKGRFGTAEHLSALVQNRAHSDSKAVLVNSMTNQAISDTIHIPASEFEGPDLLLGFTPVVDLRPSAMVYNLRVEIYTYSAITKLYTVLYQPYFVTSTAQPLPVVLTSFTGAVVGHKVNLSWTTASEAKSSRFEVESSSDGFTFYEKGSVRAGGYTSTARHYTYTLPATGTVYVRLRSVDVDGSASYSPVLAFQVAGPEAKREYLVHYQDRYYAFPLDVDDEPVSLQVIDWSGRTVSLQSAQQPEIATPGVVQLMTKNGVFYSRRVQ